MTRLEETPDALEDRRAACRRALLSRLDSDLAGVHAALNAATAGTRLDGDRPENRGERGALSAEGALAGALAARHAQLVADRAAVDALQPGARSRPGLGALLIAEDALGAACTWWLAPGASGDRVLADVIAVSPSSPIGQRWLRAEVGDEVALGGVAWTLIAVR
jgi:hypothetical protein